MRAIGRAAAAILLAACVVDPQGDFESLSGGTYGDVSGVDGSDGGGNDDSSFPPLPLECDYDLGANPLGESACTVDADCCAPPVVSLGFACPSDAYPNNWSCESNVCVQRSSTIADKGCSNDADCLFPGFICATMSGIGHCVAPCESTADCQGEHNMPNSSCEQISGYDFCMQEQP